MTYTTEEQELIEDTAKELYLDFEHFESYRTVFKTAFESQAMQQIIDSRIKQAKIEFLEELAEETPNFIKGVIDDKLTELKK